jgi:hypothetical protein
MQFIKPDVSTMCVGQAASMGAFLLCGGAKGKRYCLPNARTMIHQPSGGAQGQATDIDIQAREILIIRERLNRLMAEHTGAAAGGDRARHGARSLHGRRAEPRVRSCRRGCERHAAVPPKSDSAHRGAARLPRPDLHWGAKNINLKPLAVVWEAGQAND